MRVRSHRLVVAGTECSSVVYGVIWARACCMMGFMSEAWYPCSCSLICWQISALCLAEWSMEALGPLLVG